MARANRPYTVAELRAMTTHMRFWVEEAPGSPYPSGPAYIKGGWVVDAKNGYTGYDLNDPGDTDGYGAFLDSKGLTGWRAWVRKPTEKEWADWPWRNGTDKDMLREAGME